MEMTIEVELKLEKPQASDTLYLYDQHLKQSIQH